MNIEDKNYSINFDGRGIISMSGKLAAMAEDYEKIEDFFEKVLNEVIVTKTSELILDIRELTFLNSSGIKTLCVSLVMDADEVEGLHMKIQCNDSLTWQVETIPTFEDLMDNLEIVFEPPS